jgi:ATP-dependent helicase YprA (DUF1998 family)
MTDSTYSLQNLAKRLPQKLQQYLEAQYHIWDEYLVRERQHLLAAVGTICREPFIESTPAYVPGEPYKNLAIPRIVSEILSTLSADRMTGIPVVPYRHQVTALEAFFSSEPRELVISTGTGSGKTESFLMPIIGSLVTERQLRPDSYAVSGVRALLLYPMNALVNDQMSRLRRLLGSLTIAQSLRRANGYRSTFGMYTGRTPYPGAYDQRRTKKEVGQWIDDYFVRYEPQRKRLEEEGKWPAKDLSTFRKTFETSPDDSELLTRHEMHSRPPDVLVTNYSMLEYMLLRPVDAPIFRHTRDWLATDPNNQFIVVLDEAHVYQGAQGTEVALLLRRLVSRLRIPRERVRFILTSASLASGADAEAQIQRFANELTGRRTDSMSFRIITGQLDRPSPARPGNEQESIAFGSIDIDRLHNAENNLGEAAGALHGLAESLGLSLGRSANLDELRDSAYNLVSQIPVAAHLVGSVMGSPHAASKLAAEVFPQSNSAAALDGLLSVCAFARRVTDGRVYLPSRAHLLFRGIDGIFACVNQLCTERPHKGAKTLLGKLYSKPQRRCPCGSRVFELLTHRDCGAAYLRGYFKPDDDTFLWHEPSTGLGGSGLALSELHFLIEHERDQIGNFDQVWLHHATGQLLRNRPRDLDAYLELRQPSSAPVLIRGRSVSTFDRKCPVCLKRWQDADRPKIMDLATKGEDPFAYLIAAQVELQPKTTEPSDASPNGGRKSLLFSDGRQKAARLARDVPRVIEQDAFRQAFLLAAQHLKEARLSDSFMYAAFIAGITKNHLRFFDGPDAAQLRSDCNTFTRLYEGNIESALSDPWQVRAPAIFRVQLMRMLGNRHYSLFALGLAHVEPRKRLFGAVCVELSSTGLSTADLKALSVVWVQGLLEDFSLYSPGAVSLRSRELAAGYPVRAAGSKYGLSDVQRRYLKSEIDVPQLEAVFRKHLTEPSNVPELNVLNEDRIVLRSSLNDQWYRCNACTYLAPVTWRGRCIACGQDRILPTDPSTDVYLRARKLFWRDPVARVLAGTSTPMTLDVQEHTAQLGHRDAGDLEATTESYERRFRDILLSGEQAIDVLSCTTTMEVGIDIGSLIAVGLRNMPPSRHNYQQRAGRAGRRGSAVSTVITYAQNNPHDSFLFDNPERLIAGSAHLTGLDVNNQTLIHRHAAAELLQEYFEDTVLARSEKNVFASLGDTRPFFAGDGDGSLVQMIDWLEDSKAATATFERMSKWLPAESQLTPDLCVTELKLRLEALSPVALGELPSGEDKLIEFLFSRGVLPAYAFPRDLVALQIERVDAGQQVEIVERAQQSAHVALSEYAPGRLVVVNKLTYRIGGVSANTSPETRDRAAPLFVRPAEYLQCPNCLYTATLDNGEVSAGDTCTICDIASLKHIVAIQPQMVWPERGKEIDELDDDQSITETTVAQLPVPASDRAFGSSSAFGSLSKLSYGRQVPLVILNRGELTATGPSGFQVCSLCGHTVSGTEIFPPRHERDYHIPRRRGAKPPGLCTGTPRPVFLGYEFNTDVLLLKTPLKPPFAHDLSDKVVWSVLNDALTSLAHGLALSACDLLDIDPRELQSGFRLLRTANESSTGDIYLYDTLSGGAGYSKLIGEDFQAAFAESMTRLVNCTCDASCSDCLRTYSNRMMHAALDRRLAYQLATYIQTGVCPKLFSPTEQQAKGIPLMEMLELNGWMVEQAREFAFEVHKGSTTAVIGVIPALFDAGSLPESWGGVTVFSTHEIDKDLPSCLLKFPS